MDSKIKNIVIGCIAVLVLGLSCYFIYEKFSDKKEVNNVDSEDEKTIKNDLVNIIKEYGLDALAYEENDVIFSENPKNSQLYLAALYFTKVNEGKDYIMTREELDDFFEKVYGYKPSAYPNVVCQVEKDILYVYKDNKYFFYEEHPGHGYYGPGIIDSYVVDYTNKNNEYSISLLILHGNEMEGYSVNEEALKEDIDSSSEEKLIKYFRDNIDSYKDGVKYRYTFEKTNGKYILKSFKKEK